MAGRSIRLRPPSSPEPSSPSSVYRCPAVTSLSSRGVRGPLDRASSSRRREELHLVPVGGWWRIHGRGVVAYKHPSTSRIDCIHAVIAADSGLAARGVSIGAVLSDNGSGYNSRAGGTTAASLGSSTAGSARRISKTNGKVEQRNRTSGRVGSRRLNRSNGDRSQALARLLHYNRHRCHTGLGGPR